jgi:hypothetical protein
MERIEVIKTRNTKNEVRYVAVFGQEVANLINKKSVSAVTALAKAVGEVKNGQMTFENLDTEVESEPAIPSIDDFEVTPEDNKIEL